MRIAVLILVIFAIAAVGKSAPRQRPEAAMAAILVILGLLAVLFLWR